MSTWKPFVIPLCSKLCQQYKLEGLAHHKKLCADRISWWGVEKACLGEKVLSTLFNLRYLENIIRSCKSLMCDVKRLEYVWDQPQLHPTPSKRDMWAEILISFVCCSVISHSQCLAMGPVREFCYVQLDSRRHHKLLALHSSLPNSPGRKVISARPKLDIMTFSLAI